MEMQQQHQAHAPPPTAVEMKCFYCCLVAAAAFGWLLVGIWWIWTDGRMDGCGEEKGAVKFRFESMRFCE
jgi:hypothetical protein